MHYSMHQINAALTAATNPVTHPSYTPPLPFSLGEALGAESSVTRPSTSVVAKYEGQATFGNAGELVAPRRVNFYL